MELQAFDFNGNGIPDQISYDTNGDMRPDLWRLDKDNDHGSTSTHWTPMATISPTVG